MSGTSNERRSAFTAGMAPGTDPGGDGVVPALDLLEGQRPELAAPEGRQDVGADEVLILSPGGGLDVTEQPHPFADPVLGFGSVSARKRDYDPSVY